MAITALVAMRVENSTPATTLPAIAVIEIDNMVGKFTATLFVGFEQVEIRAVIVVDSV